MTESNKRLKTKRNIEEAMVRLLEKESFDQITTVELAQESGISRSSFYTHYRDKYDMIERYQQALFHKLEYIFDKHQDDKRQAITEVFEFLTKEPLFAVLLTENGTKEIQTFLRHKLQILLVDSLQERYSHKLLTDIEEAMTLSDRIYILNHNPGEIVADFPVKWDLATDRDWQQLQYKKQILELLTDSH